MNNKANNVIGNIILFITETISQNVAEFTDENRREWTFNLRFTFSCKFLSIVYLFLDFYINQSLFLVGYITRILSKNIHFHEKGSCHGAFVQGRR